MFLDVLICKKTHRVNPKAIMGCQSVNYSLIKFVKVENVFGCVNLQENTQGKS